jgi:membrane fusion protein (multidrug efflux system)
MKKVAVSLLAIAGLGALGWWGYQAHRGATRPALEITEKSATQVPAAAGGERASAPAAAAGPSKAAGGPGAGRGPVAVEAARAQQVALSEEVFAAGTLRANESVVLKPEIAGRIVQLGFSDGARVASGALLVALDASVLAAQAEQARAELGLARTNFERTQDLAKRNFVSGSALDQAAANLRVQEARLHLAEAQLAKTRIVAPFPGVLGLRNISVGDYVKDGADLVTLEDVTSMKVDLRLPERFLGQLQRGQAISVSVDAFPEREFRATLDALDAQVDANGRSVLARGRLANPEGVLRSGMFAKARIRLKDKPSATVVPEEAILPVGNDAFVYRVDGGKAYRTKVVTGLRREGRVEIVAGVSPGDLVVTAGQLKLQRDGAEVRVVEPARRGPPPAAGAPAQPGKGG